MIKRSVFFVVLGLLLLGCSSSEESARKLHNQAMLLQQAGNYEEAKSIYRTIVEKYPETQTAVEVNKGLLASNEIDRLGEFIIDKSVKETLAVSLDAFRLDNGRYPTTEEGLAALLSNPGLQTWDGPYVQDPIQWAEKISSINYHGRQADYDLN